MSTDIEECVENLLPMEKIEYYENRIQDLVEQNLYLEREVLNLEKAIEKESLLYAGQRKEMDDFLHDSHHFDHFHQEANNMLQTEVVKLETKLKLIIDSQNHIKEETEGKMEKRKEEKCALSNQVHDLRIRVASACLKHGELMKSSEEEKHSLVHQTSQMHMHLPSLRIHFNQLESELYASMRKLEGKKRDLRQLETAYLEKKALLSKFGT